MPGGHTGKKLPDVWKTLDCCVAGTIALDEGGDIGGVGLFDLRSTGVGLPDLRSRHV